MDAADVPDPPPSASHSSAIAAAAAADASRFESVDSDDEEERNSDDGDGSVDESAGIVASDAWPSTLPPRIVQYEHGAHVRRRAYRR